MAIQKKDEKIFKFITNCYEYNRCCILHLKLFNFFLCPGQYHWRKDWKNLLFFNTKKEDQEKAQFKLPKCFSSGLISCLFLDGQKLILKNMNAYWRYACKLLQIEKKSSKLNRETTKTTRKWSEGKKVSITVKNF